MISDALYRAMAVHHCTSLLCTLGPTKFSYIAITRCQVIRNSWGTWWGEGGWGKIIRGRDNLGIESQDVYWALPNVADFP